MYNKKKLIILGFITISIVIIQRLYYSGIIPIEISLILSIVALIIIKNIDKLFNLEDNSNNKYLESPNQESDENKKERVVSQMSEEEKKEKIKVLGKIYKFAPIIIIFLFFLVDIGKLDGDYLEFWLSSMSIALIYYLMPRDELLKTLKKDISRFGDIIAYTLIILAIVWLLMKFVFKII